MTEVSIAQTVGITKQERAFLRQVHIAVLHERERCARVAEDHYGREFCSDVTAQKIADAIRKGE